MVIVGKRHFFVKKAYLGPISGRPFWCDILSELRYHNNDNNNNNMLNNIFRWRGMNIFNMAQ